MNVCVSQTEQENSSLLLAQPHWEKRSRNPIARGFPCLLCCPPLSGLTGDDRPRAP